MKKNLMAAVLCAAAGPLLAAERSDESLPAQSGADLSALTDAAKSPEVAKVLFQLCDANRDGVLHGDEIRNYYMSLSEPVFEKYDGNCDGEITNDEENRYLDDKLKKAEARAREDLEFVRRYTARRVRDEVTEAGERRDPITAVNVARLVPDASVKKEKLTGKFVFTNEPAQNIGLGAVEWTREWALWKVGRSTSFPQAVGLELAFGVSRKEVETATAETRTDDFTWRPLSYTIMTSDERLTFKMSAGGARVRSVEEAFATGERVRKKNDTFAYAAEIAYKPKRLQCLEVGVSYKVSTRKAFDEQVQAVLGPTFGYDFLCAFRNRLLAPRRLHRRRRKVCCE